MTPTGEVAVGGNFTTVGGAVSAYFARVGSTCAPTVASHGSGCVGTGGLNELQTDELPWLEATFDATASGIAPNSIALGVYGFGTASSPISAILPQGLPGCSLLVTPDLMQVYLPAAGAVTTSLPIPNNSALIGQVVHHQVVPFVFAPLGGILEITATNRLELAIGTF